MVSRAATLSDYGYRAKDFLNIVAQKYQERTGFRTNLGKSSVISFADVATFIQGKRVICGFDSDGECEILNKRSNIAEFDDVIIVLASIMLNRITIKNSVFDEAFIDDFFDTIEEFMNRHGIQSGRETS